MSREMRHSGIEWIGEIPKEWDLKRFQSQVIEIKEKNSPIKTNFILSLTINDGVIPYEEKGNVGNISKDNHEEYKLAYPDTIVLNSMNILIGAVGICKYYGCVSPVYYVFKNVESSDLRFLNYILSSPPFQKYLRKFANGILEIRLRISSSDILKQSIPVPSLAEQQKIANYLDKVCGEVDEMIALQEQMIEELKAYKQSVITEAVTKGLNPDVPMKDSASREQNHTCMNYAEAQPVFERKFKDSGIDWIGEVPEEWLVSKAKFFVIIGNGSDPKTEGNTPVYGSGSTSFKTCGEYKLGPTVLIGRKGATLHIPHFIEGKYWNVDTAFDVKSKGHISLRYYYYLAICFDYKSYISQTTLPGMAQNSYNNMEIPVPPLSEQQSIASYLDTKCSEIDALIAIKQAKIDELKDYKKSIIYEYVTGKKEVV